MKKNDSKTEKELLADLENMEREDNDKAPGEEKNKVEKVRSSDLKGKKVDADPAEPKDSPLGTTELWVGQ